MPLPVEAAYLAGFIDGDGSIGIYYLGDHHRDNRNGSRYYIPRLSVCNANAEVLEYLQYVWGGSLLTTAHEGNPHNPAGLYRLQWQAQADLLCILPEIIPYLVVKKEQAELLLTWCESRQNRPTHKAGYTTREVEIAMEISRLASGKGRERKDRMEVII